MRFVILWLILSLSCSALASKTHEFQLDNGLRLIVREDHRAPVVVSQIWYKVGSSYEHGGITGISHALEHMMFRGTEKYPEGELDRRFAEVGARQNAATSADFTVYYQELPADRLALSFELEADRMRNLTLREEAFKKEIQVVMEERRLRTEDHPQAATYERFHASAFVINPYRYPTIGWMQDLQQMRVEDLTSWYQRWYAPNNAILVVVGDVDPQAVLHLAIKYFGDLRPSNIEPPKDTMDPEPPGRRTVEVQAPAQVPWLVMGYNVPTLLTAPSSEDAYALEVIAAVLSGGNSARLPTELIRKHPIASDASAAYDLYGRLSSLLVLMGTPMQGKTVEHLKTAFLNQIEKLQTTRVTKPELARIKAQVIAAKVYKRDLMIHQANEIGMLASVGLSWKTAEEYEAHIQAITPELIQSIAKRYLTPDRLTIAELKPHAR